MEHEITRDYTLKTNQEDIKSWDSYGLMDGYYSGTVFTFKTANIDFKANCSHETDHAVEAWEIEYSEGLGWVDDHWEAEFAIPFVGHDGAAQDVSDLSCTIEDTIGFKLYYYTFNPGQAQNFYYPSGTELEIGTYANLDFAPLPTIESCDAAGTKKDVFDVGETVYISGSGYPASSTFDLYIVADVTAWTDGMTIPERVSGAATTISSDISGIISPTAVWNAPTVLGKYDIVVDIDGNGVYNVLIDSLDSDDVDVTAGFVISEFSLGMFALFIMGTLLATVACKRKAI